ncbi:hypothetical protein RCJ22_13350 [Vibrio sp. FNV 38]|nr:hypothetical protein [Vibrio sp. FNV 38]
MNTIFMMALTSVTLLSGVANAGYQTQVSSSDQVTRQCTTMSGDRGHVVDAKQYGYVCSELGMNDLQAYQQCQTSGGEEGSLVDAKEYGYICQKNNYSTLIPGYSCTDSKGNTGHYVDAKGFGYICMS